MTGLYSMTPAEIEILKAGTIDPNAFLGYFLRRPGQEVGWQLDANFTEKGRWQKAMCLASQSFIIVISGIATGKTLGVGMSAATHAALTPDFKFLNIARESWQSQLMYTALLEYTSGTLYEKLIVNSPKRPYPAIIVEYMVGNQKIHSTLEFMSIGEEKDATNIFSWRGDWVNIDEAGRLDNLSEIIGNLSTRGTGITPNRRPYLGRISIISNPWENLDMWQLFDMAAADKEDSLAINLETGDNLNVTPKQIKQVLKLVPEGDRDRFLSGKRPEGKGAYFSKATVEKCESQILSKSLIDAISRQEDGYERVHLGHLGTFFFKTPPKKGRVYFVIGDPGTLAAPARNSPVTSVWDVTEVPKGPAVLVAFHWGSGGGSITPFVSQLIEWIDYYKPIFVGVDSTGPQKNTAEIINLEYIVGQGKSIDGITGLDFSGNKKYSYLVSLRLSLESRALVWPHIVTGISAQLKHYDPIIDRNPNSKLAQDNVSVLAMASFAIRAHYGIFNQENSEENSDAGGKNSFLRRQSRIGTNRKSRDTISSTRNAFGATGTKKTTVGDLDEYILPH